MTRMAHVMNGRGFSTSTRVHSVCSSCVFILCVHPRVSILSLQADGEKLKKGLLEMTQAKAAADKDVATLKKQLADLEAALKTSRDESATLTTQLKAATDDGEKLKKGLLEMTQAKAAADGEIAALKKQLADLQV